METEKKNIIRVNTIVAIALAISTCLLFFSPVETYAEPSDSIATAVYVEEGYNDIDKWQKDLDAIINKTSKSWENDKKKYKAYITKSQKADLNDIVSNLKDSQSIASAKEFSKDYNAAIKFVKSKKTAIANFDKRIKKYKPYVNASNAKKAKAYKTKIKKSESQKAIDRYAAKLASIVSAAKAAKKKADSWVGYAQASCYGPYEGEFTTATGRTITNGTYYVAVPMGRIVSKSTWNSMSASGKKTHFYYHETVYLIRNGHTVKASVEDCGGFGGIGTTYNGKWCDRLFDLTPAVFHALGINGTGIVKWRY